MLKQSTVAALAMGGLAPGDGQAACAGNCRGFDVTAVYTGEPIRNFDGGAREGSTYLDNLDLQLAADRGSIFGIPGLAGFAYIVRNNASTFSDEYVGDTQVVSNIDAPEAWRIYELWLDWSPGDDERFSARFGLYDLNSEFDVSDGAGLFFNSSHGINPSFSLTGLNGPSIFPVTSLGLRLRGTVAGDHGGYWQAVALDGVPGDPDDPSSDEIKLSSDEGALLALEFGVSRGAWRKLAIGGWLYTADFDQLVGTDPGGEPARNDGNAGLYAIGERELASGGFGKLAGFLRAGYGSEQFNQVEYYAGGGLVLDGFWPSRAQDQVGLAFATAINGGDYREAQRLAGESPDNHETAIELTYRAPITGWLTLQPDLQYVVNPGTNPALDDALVIGLRFEVAWSRSF